MVSGFISSVQGHIINDKFVVLAKVRHSQRMNDSLIPVWIITEKQGTIISAHCCGCKAGLGESCSHVAYVPFYLEAWTIINGKLSCAQLKCSWILPSYVKEVEYARVRDINFTSAKKMKADLDATLDGLLETSEVSNSAVKSVLLLLMQRALYKKAEKFQQCRICRTLNITISHIKNSRTDLFWNKNRNKNRNKAFWWWNNGDWERR